jgi:hypothetical protein
MRKLSGLIILSLVVMFSCSSGDVRKNDIRVEDPQTVTTQINNNTIVPEVQPREYNFKFVGFDVNIDDPSWDRRSYYRIFIDKIDAGRTTIGLESQKKTFEAKIAGNNRHLLVVEKWVLDEKKGQYVKLNNIEQPKPGYLYFELPDDKAAVIKLKNDPLNNKSEFLLEFE